MKNICIALSCLALFACGGGGSPATAVVTPASPGGSTPADPTAAAPTAADTTADSSVAAVSLVAVSSQ